MGTAALLALTACSGDSDSPRPDEAAATSSAPLRTASAEAMPSCAKEAGGRFAADAPEVPTGPRAVACAYLTDSEGQAARTAGLHQSDQAVREAMEEALENAGSPVG